MNDFACGRRVMRPAQVYLSILRALTAVRLVPFSGGWIGRVAPVAVTDFYFQLDGFVAETRNDDGRINCGWVEESSRLPWARTCVVSHQMKIRAAKTG
jgi:hypothetical protein